MKWPWVSRDLDAIHIHRDALASRVRELETEILFLRTSRETLSGICDRETIRADESRKSYADLLAKYHELKLAGAVIPEPAPVLPERKRDALLEAINAKAGRNGLLRDRMMAQLRKDRQMIATGQMTEADVLARIEQGESPAEEALPI